MLLIIYLKMTIKHKIENGGYLITRDERANKSEGTCYTRIDFLGCQLKQPDRNNNIHACFNQGQRSFN